ncbi:MAG: glycosyltransferase family protein [Hyphomicrobiaceae bacterium]
MRVFYYVQHLLGIGHVFRALRIARALVEANANVDFVLGGAPPSGEDLSGLDLVRLPVIRSGSGGFSDLVQENGRPVDPAFKTARRDTLLAEFRRARPDVVLIEAFPFGRRQMRFELLPLLEAARTAEPKPVVVCSIRDILQENRKPERDTETLTLLADAFDHVIVHGDRRFVRLDETFPRVADIVPPVTYSGYVAPKLGSGPAGSAYGVIVSAGGGAVGRALIEAALHAKPHTALAKARWLCLTGQNMPQEDSAKLVRLAAAQDVELAGFRANLVGALAQARLSVSQAGYNTVADILVAGCAAVLVPFAAQGETEQTHRARRLERSRTAVAVEEATLTPAILAAAIDRASTLPRERPAIDLDGAQRTAAILRSLCPQDAGP